MGKGLTYIDVAESGAGTNGPLEVGAWAALWNAGYRPNSLECASAGSIVGALLALGKTPSDLKHIVMNADYASLINYAPLSIIGRWTLASAANVRAWLREITEDQIMADCQIPLTTVSSSLATQKPVYWRSHEVPQMPVWQAVYASMAIPFIFPPYLEEYVDGGVLDNLPVNQLPNSGRRLALMVTNHTPTGKPSGPVDEALRLLSMMLSANEEQACALAASKGVPVVKLDAKNMGFLDREQTPVQKVTLWQAGYNAVETFLATESGIRWAA